MTKSVNQLVASKVFHHFIVAVIVLAGVVAGLETSPAMLDRHGPILLGLDRFILGVFIVEALLKMAAHGRQPWRYFADGWNVFDFLIVVLCLLPVGGPFAAVLRLTRALRLLRYSSRDRRSQQGRQTRGQLVYRPSGRHGRRQGNRRRCRP